MARIVYLDTSAVLRAVLESGTTPDIDAALGSAQVLVTSRLSLVESARALLRLRIDGMATESQIASAAREIDSIWARCAIWELTRSICELAAQAAPTLRVRALDAIHLATYLNARRRLGEIDLLTTDRRLAEAAGL
ncbi:MAG: type II toxin-antitoxin system VapC family toxin [Gemmatimonadota bacterium]